MKKIFAFWKHRFINQRCQHILIPQNILLYIFMDTQKAFQLNYARLIAKGRKRLLHVISTCASFSITPAKQKYLQIDLEATAFDFTYHRFCIFLLGRTTFKATTDHKLLVSVFNSNDLGSTRVNRIKSVYKSSNLFFTNNPANPTRLIIFLDTQKPYI